MPWLHANNKIKQAQEMAKRIARINKIELATTAFEGEEEGGHSSGVKKAVSPNLPTENGVIKSDVQIQYSNASFQEDSQETQQTRENSQISEDLTKQVHIFAIERCKVFTEPDEHRPHKMQDPSICEKIKIKLSTYNSWTIDHTKTLPDAAQNKNKVIKIFLFTLKHS